jgi:hypothetical protein
MFLEDLYYYTDCTTLESVMYIMSQKRSGRLLKYSRVYIYIYIYIYLGT